MEFFLKEIGTKKKNPLRIKLSTKQRKVIIGRETISSLCSHHRVSREHASFIYRNGDWYVQDMNSMNGLFVNYQRVGYKPHRLEVGDNIGFGMSSINEDGGIVCVLIANVSKQNNCNAINRDHEAVFNLNSIKVEDHTSLNMGRPPFQSMNPSEDGLQTGEKVGTDAIMSDVKPEVNLVNNLSSEQSAVTQKPRDISIGQFRPNVSNANMGSCEQNLASNKENINTFLKQEPCANADINATVSTSDSVNTVNSTLSKLPIITNVCSLTVEQSGNSSLKGIVIQSNSTVTDTSNENLTEHMEASNVNLTVTESDLSSSESSIKRPCKKKFQANRNIISSSESSSSESQDEDINISDSSNISVKHKRLKKIAKSYILKETNHSASSLSSEASEQSSGSESDESDNDSESAKSTWANATSSQSPVTESQSSEIESDEDNDSTKSQESSDITPSFAAPSLQNHHFAPSLSKHKFETLCPDQASINSISSNISDSIKDCNAKNVETPLSSNENAKITRRNSDSSISSHSSILYLSTNEKAINTKKVQRSASISQESDSSSNKATGCVQNTVKQNLKLPKSICRGIIFTEPKPLIRRPKYTRGRGEWFEERQCQDNESSDSMELPHKIGFAKTVDESAAKCKKTCKTSAARRLVPKVLGCKKVHSATSQSSISKTSHSESSNVTLRSRKLLKTLFSNPPQQRGLKQKPVKTLPLPSQRLNCAEIEPNAFTKTFENNSKTTSNSAGAKTKMIRNNSCDKSKGHDEIPKSFKQPESDKTHLINLQACNQKMTQTNAQSDTEKRFPIKITSNTTEEQLSRKNPINTLETNVPRKKDLIEKSRGNSCKSNNDNFVSYVKSINSSSIKMHMKENDSSFDRKRKNPGNSDNVTSKISCNSLHKSHVSSTEVSKVTQLRNKDKKKEENKRIAIVNPIHSKERTAIASETISPDSFIKSMLIWNPKWLEEQKDIQKPPPTIWNGSVYLPLTFTSYEQYASSFYKLIGLEIWETIFKDFHEKDSKTWNNFYCSVLSHETKNEMTEILCQSIYSRNLPYCPIEGDVILLDLEEGELGTENYIFGYVNKHSTSDFHETSLKLKSQWSKLPFEWSSNTKLRMFTVVVKKRTMPLLFHSLLLAYGVGNIKSKLNWINALQLFASSPLKNCVLNPQKESYFFTDEIVKGDRLKTKSRSHQIINAITHAVVQPDSRLIVLHGGPGTGKTHIIIGLINNLLETPSNKKVIVLTPTVTGINEITSRLIELNQNRKSKEIEYFILGDPKAVAPHAKSQCLDIAAYEKYHHDMQIEKEDRNRRLKLLEDEMNLYMFARCQNNAEIRRDDPPKKLMDEYKELKDKTFNPYNSLSERIIKCQLLLRSDVLIGTINSFMLEDVVRRTLQETGYSSALCCIVDRAAQCTESELLQCFLPSITKIILVGDYQQCPPTVNSQCAIKLGFRRSMFERLRAFYKKFHRHDSLEFTYTLFEQYRMHSQICHFPSKHFYNQRLVASPGLDEFYKFSPFEPYVVYDVKKDPFNVREEKMIISCMCSLIFKSLPVATIGIITSNINQAKVYRNTLHQVCPGMNVEVCTVDDFEATSKDIVILYDMHCPDSRETDFLSCERKLNFALTRARRSLVVCGRISLLGYHKHWRHLADNAKQRDLYFTVNTLQEMSTILDNTLLKSV